MSGPEWTNANDHDPGITILEASAFLATSVLYMARSGRDRSALKLITAAGVGATAATAVYLTRRQREQQTRLGAGIG